MYIARLLAHYSTLSQIFIASKSSLAPNGGDFLLPAAHPVPTAPILLRFRNVSSRFIRRIMRICVSKTELCAHPSILLLASNDVNCERRCFVLWMHKCVGQNKRDSEMIFTLITKKEKIPRHSHDILLNLFHFSKSTWRRMSKSIRRTRPGRYRGDGRILSARQQRKRNSRLNFRWI